ncbi:MAG: hypothetical protein ABEJ67_05515 [Halanaeroarchaeum sp.]
MYRSAFDTEWSGLDREEAMFRAYALGVDAALGTDHPEEVERLMRETSRPLVQLAFDEGKSRAEEAVRESERSPTDEVFRPSERDWEIWEELVVERKDDPSSFETVRVRPSRIDRPRALDRPSLLDRTDRDVTAVELPRFLLR